MNSRRITAILIGLLLAAFGITTSATVTAKAATTAPGHQATIIGITSSGQIINLEKPPAWLRPNTLVRPLNYISPDTLSADGYQICNGGFQCLNDWFGGGPGTDIRWYQYGESNQESNWIGVASGWARGVRVSQLGVSR
jgi:hypothetical protein